MALSPSASRVFFPAGGYVVRCSMEKESISCFVFGASRFGGVSDGVRSRVLPMRIRLVVFVVEKKSGSPDVVCCWRGGVRKENLKRKKTQDGPVFDVPWE